MIFFLTLMFLSVYLRCRWLRFCIKFAGIIFPIVSMLCNHCNCFCLLKDLFFLRHSMSCICSLLDFSPQWWQISSPGFLFRINKGDCSWKFSSNLYICLSYVYLNNYGLIITDIDNFSRLIILLRSNSKFEGIFSWHCNIIIYSAYVWYVNLTLYGYFHFFASIWQLYENWLFLSFTCN